MRAVLQWAGLTLVSALAALAAWGHYRANPGCQAVTARAEISKRAAEICTSELVGCSLTFAQVKEVVADQRAAEGCK